MTARETEFKKKELEQLLREKKIDVDQYLEALAKLEGVPIIEVKPEGHRLLKTDFLLIASPFLILVGWLVSNLNALSGYSSISSGYELMGYPYSPIGLAIMMCAIILLSVGISYRWVKSVSRGEFIILEIVGVFLVIFGLFVLISGFSYVWVQQTPYSWHSFISINPAYSSLGLLLWFAGVFTITCGLAPLSKWFSKNIG
jgi:hypothetical protein